ncbi:multidrug ABC transporter ATP-binding protein [Mesoplasma florum]|nr:multidrug ABC transporter ATP-binding protein [Mesoplasma florum]
MSRIRPIWKKGQLMISINNVSKKYGEKVGNFNINIQIKKGEIYGIIGPNGAGKTTLIRQILGFVKPDDGNITINSMDSWEKRQEIMEWTGYIAGEVSIYEDYTGMQFLKLMSNLKANVDWSFVEKLIEYFELDTSRKIKKMSKGMKQKIAIISATMNKPAFLVLDEPTSGLDPIMQQRFNELILKLKKENSSTVIICSHIFEEVVALADNVGMIKSGELIEEFVIKEKNIEIIREKFKSVFIKESIL